MDRFRVFMGFLLAGAAVWLLYVLSSQVSAERLAFIELALLGLAFGVWWRHQGGRVVPKLASVVILACAVTSLVLAAGEPLPLARLAALAPKCTPALARKLVAELNEELGARVERRTALMAQSPQRKTRPRKGASRGAQHRRKQPAQRRCHHQ